MAGQPFRADLVACGEVGLSGEIRSGAQVDRRLGEAFRLGFRSAIVPTSVTSGPVGMRLLPVATLSEALTHLPIAAGSPF